MSNLFYNKSFKNINFDISDWNVSNANNMNSMFYGCSKFKGKGLENWNVSNVKDMNYMLEGCTLIKNKPSWYKE